MTEPSPCGPARTGNNGADESMSHTAGDGVTVQFRPGAFDKLATESRQEPGTDTIT